MKKILVINCGSTSTKLASFEDNKKIFEKTLRMDSAETANSKERGIRSRIAPRTESVRNFIAESGLDISSFDMIACRGGIIPGLKGGAYRVDKYMTDYEKASDAGHASSISSCIGYELSKEYGVPCMIYDAVTIDEKSELAHFIGLKGERQGSGGHMLNARATARKVADDLGVNFKTGKFVVAHVGGGVSVSAVIDGLLQDVTTDVVTPERIGYVDFPHAIDLCFSGKYTKHELQKMCGGSGGFVSLMGTSDAAKVEEMALAGDEYARFLYEAMAYQLSKAIGAMIAVCRGEPDAVIMTGALARSDLLVGFVRGYVEKMGRFMVVPGEMELEALAAGAMRVLSGEESLQVFTDLPMGISSIEEFYEKNPDLN